MVSFYGKIANSHRLNNSWS